MFTLIIYNRVFWVAASFDWAYLGYSKPRKVFQNTKNARLNGMLQRGYKSWRHPAKKDYCLFKMELRMNDKQHCFT